MSRLLLTGKERGYLKKTSGVKERKKEERKGKFMGEARASNGERGFDVGSEWKNLTSPLVGFLSPRPIRGREDSKIREVRF